MASSPADTEKDEVSKPKYLLLIDLNGTMCYRGPKKVSDAPAPDAKLRGRYVYARPFLRAFMRSLLAVPGLQVCITTSITERNAVPLIRSILGSFLTLEDWMLPREICTKAASPPAETSQGGSAAEEHVPWKTVRDIKSIWAEIDNRGLSFDETNTIVIDGEEHKVAECIDNAVLIPEFNPADRQDDTLNYLAKYVSDLVKHSPDDVRTYIKNNPSCLEDFPEEGATTDKATDETKEQDKIEERDGSDSIASVLSKLQL